MKIVRLFAVQKTMFAFCMSSIFTGNLMRAAAQSVAKDNHGNQLKYSEVKFINNSSMPCKVSWYEQEGGSQHPIEHTIEPGSKKVLSLGARGLFFNSKITYNPIQLDPKFTRNFVFDLSESPEFVFEAKSMAEVIKLISIPILSTIGDDGQVKTKQFATSRQTNDLNQTVELLMNVDLRQAAPATSASTGSRPELEKP